MLFLRIPPQRGPADPQLLSHRGLVPLHSDQLAVDDIAVDLVQGAVEIDGVLGRIGAVDAFFLGQEPA